MYIMDSLDVYKILQNTIGVFDMVDVGNKERKAVLLSRAPRCTSVH